MHLLARAGIAAAILSNVTVAYTILPTTDAAGARTYDLDARKFELQGPYSKPDIHDAGFDVAAELLKVLPAHQPINISRTVAALPHPPPGERAAAFSIDGDIAVRPRYWDMHTLSHEVSHIIDSKLPTAQGHNPYTGRPAALERRYGWRPAPKPSDAAAAAAAAAQHLPGAGGKYSDSLRWRGAEKGDERVVSRYALTSWAEHFAETAGVGLLEVFGGAGTVDRLSPAAGQGLKGQVGMWVRDWGRVVGGGPETCEEHVRPAQPEFVILAIRLARISGLVNLFSRLADAVILIIFFELGHGFMYARLGTVTVYRSVLRSLSVTIALVAAVTALASTGIYMANVESWLEEIYKYHEDWRMTDFRTYANATVAADVLRWAATLPAIAYAAHVVKVWSGSGIRLITGRYLLATGIMFLRCFTFIGFEGTLGPDMTPSDPAAARGTFREGSSWPSVKFAAHALSWVFFVMVTVILASFGAKNNDGLWTTKQPFHADCSPIPDPTFGEEGQSTVMMNQLHVSDDERTMVSIGSMGRSAARHDGQTRV
ncbi:hypothetical protein PoMZ_11815 [Pyricularia oryzae]|uniref:Uncharacterized protein n=1 Tax=Pyricularia oryzae TaxID=318829 RepID=A0A4P7NLH4_PYROR|nr:hypothetical protein PoMZ_11815 [Pyricularia oryzae]